jgi:hypothetical protein
LPLIDETHFRLQVSYLLKHWTEEQAARELTQAASRRPCGLSAAQALAMQTVYLVDMLRRLLEEGYDAQDEMLVWYRRVLRRLSPTRREAALV